MGMPNDPLDFVIFIGRICAFLFGCVSFYLAFFLYEDENGVWQNRVENLWVSIHDRARETDTLGTAMLNKSAQALLTVSNLMFGKSPLSLQMIVVSANLTTASIPLAFLYTYIRDNGTRSRIIDLLLEGIVLILLIGGAALAMKCPRWWGLLLSCIPIGNIIRIYLVSFQCALGSHVSFKCFWFDWVDGRDFVIVLLMSITLDVLAISLIRRLFSTIAFRTSLFPIVLRIAVLIAICIAVEPELVYGFWKYGLRGMTELETIENLPSTPNVLRYNGAFVTYMNATTVIYCAIPAIVLFVLLAHRAFWPLLSRTLYPFARFRILVNTKAMAAVGSLAFTLAFDLERIGLKELLKLVT